MSLTEIEGCEPALVLRLSSIKVDQLVALTNLAISTLAYGIRLGLSDKKSDPLELDKDLNNYFGLK